MMFNLEDYPDAQKLIEDWTAAKPGLRVVRIGYSEPHYLKVEACDKRKVGWAVCTVDWHIDGWEQGPVARAFGFQMLFQDVEAIALGKTPDN